MKIKLTAITKDKEYSDYIEGEIKDLEEFANAVEKIRSYLEQEYKIALINEKESDLAILYLINKETNNHLFLVVQALQK